MKTLFKILAGLVVLALVAALAGWLVLRRDDIPYETLEAKYGGGELARYVDLPNGVRAHYRDQGPAAAPTLVLVHGFSASVHIWEPWAEALSQDHRVISIDLPGHGLTRAPEGYVPSMEAFAEHVEAVTRAVGAERFVLVGSSMGGHAAWTYALKYPDRLSGLVLVGASGWPEAAQADQSDPAIFRILRHPLGRAVLRDLDMSRLTREGLESAFEPQPQRVDDAMAERYVSLARAPGHRDIILAIMASPRTPATAERLATISIPTLVMTGDGDRLVPPDHARRFAAAIPGSSLVVFDQTGHMPMESAPERSLAALKAWMETEVGGEDAQ